VEEEEEVRRKASNLVSDYCKVQFQIYEKSYF